MTISCRLHGGCVEDGLDNFEVGLASALPAEGEAVDASSYTMCGQYSGVVGVGEQTTVDCASGSRQFRYIIIRSADTTPEKLCMAEVAVYAETRGMYCSVLFFSRPRSEGWPHHRRTFSSYLCLPSF